ncbi:unnamed protein product [Prunus armeniaca]
MRRDLELVEGISKHDTNLAASVYRDAPNVKIRYVGADNDWVIKREDNATLLLLAKGNGGPACFLRLWQASLLSAEDLVRIGGADIMFDGVVGDSSHGRATTDG